MPSNKEHLPEAEIQAFERLGDGALRDRLSSMPVPSLVALVIQLFTSYRLAARVANAAWAFVREPSVRNDLILRGALSDYAPSHFSKHVDEIETLVDELTVLLIDCRQMSREEFLVLLEARLEDWKKELHRVRDRRSRPPW